MNWFSRFQDSLGLKLFISYLAIIIVGGFVLASTAEFHAPTVLQRHIDRMQMVMGSNPEMIEDFRENFDHAFNEILLVASVVSLVAAIGVSVFVTHRIVEPIRLMMRASHQIAAGQYHERVPVLGNDELGALAQSFNQMAAELEQTEQRRLDLIGNVAHELRTPLSSVRGTIEGVVDGVLPAEAETFHSVQRELSRLQRLVYDLEELSRAEAKQLSIHKQETLIQDCIEQVVSRLAFQYEGKGVDLQVSVPGDLPPIFADPERMVQVMLNLLGNALQYTPSGKSVRLSTRQGADIIVIDIQDEGIGIDADHLPYLFERFYRVDKSRSRAGGGSGIGLTISKHLIEAHDGQITASSPGVEQGSTFTIRLPILSST